MAFDGQAGVVLSAYRTYLQSHNRDWLKHYWPKIKAAMDFLINNNDPHRTGLLSGPQPTTLDTSESGTGSWLGSLYLASVNATAHMASIVDDKRAASADHALYAAGQAAQQKLLWNGAYYGEVSQNFPGTVSYGSGSAMDMLLGQWWSTQLGLGDIYNSKDMTTAAANLFKNNFTTSFAGLVHVFRTFVEPDQRGTQLITWPRGGMPANPPRFFDETWTGPEYAAAATMIQRGDLVDALTVVRAVSDRYDGRLQTDLTLSIPSCGAGDGGGNPFGDFECGPWYSRSMSSWSLLTALQGSTYDGPDRNIGFAPQWSPQNHKSFFTAGRSYGTFTQTQTANQTDTIQVASGSLPLRRVQLRIQDGVKRSVNVKSVNVKLDNKQVHGATLRTNGTLATVTFPSLTLRAGSNLSIQLGQS